MATRLRRQSCDGAIQPRRDPPAPKDDLDIDAELRFTDTAAELAFLAMKICHRRAPARSRKRLEA
jgi:hypothetical protein